MQGRIFGESVQTKSYKEVKERKGDRSLRVAGAIAVFLETETIVSLSKNGKDCPKIFQLPRKDHIQVSAVSVCAILFRLTACASFQNLKKVPKTFD